MGRTMNKLTARTVETAKEPGKYGDGGGLYLVISKDGDSLRRRWLLYFNWNGKRRELGLGSAREVSLAMARAAAERARQLVRDGVDPIRAKKQEPTRIPTFGEVADAYVQTMKPQFRNEKHIAQWSMTLTTYAAPLRGLPASEIKTEDVLAVLKPLWGSKPETASRLRGRIERVLDAAKAKGFRSGENPAAWRGHLSNLLPKRTKLSRGHHAAMAYTEVPHFVAQLRTKSATAARALEFAILTAARSGEVREATWAEFDLTAQTWTVPARRMKAGREHRVPLPSRAIEILQEMALNGTEPGGYVFPGSRTGRPLSVMAMDMTLRRMNVDVTVHGFRSSFRDWAGEESHFPREIAEAALAHVVGDQTERAYRRGDALEKRRQLMAAWEEFVSRSADEAEAAAELA